jgi:hypothetical protein
VLPKLNGVPDDVWDGGDLSPGEIIYPAPRTLTNTGSGPLRVVDLDNQGGKADDFFGETDCLDTTIPPGGSCSIDVMFGPTGYGDRATTLVVSTEEAVSPVTVTLVGRATDGYYLATSAGVVMPRGDAVDYGDLRRTQSPPRGLRNLRTVTGWWPPTGGSSPSATRPSRARPATSG